MNRSSSAAPRARAKSRWQIWGRRMHGARPHMTSASGRIASRASAGLNDMVERTEHLPGTASYPRLRHIERTVWDERTAHPLAAQST